MQGKATIGGHPIHPMLIPLPIGFFIGALICDIVSTRGDAAFWPRMALTLVGFGIIAALVAAIFGFVDYATAPMSAGAKKTATTHLAINLAVVVLFAIEFFVRMQNVTSSLGYVLEVVAVIALGVSGYLGGHLAYHYLVGADTSPGDGRERSVTGTITSERFRTPTR